MINNKLISKYINLENAFASAYNKNMDRDNLILKNVLENSEDIKHLALREQFDSETIEKYNYLNSFEKYSIFKYPTFERSNGDIIISGVNELELGIFDKGNAKLIFNVLGIFNSRVDATFDKHFNIRNVKNSYGADKLVVPLDTKVIPIYRSDNYLII